MLGSMRVFARHLERQGFRPTSFTYDSMRLDLGAMAESLAEHVAPLDGGRGHIHFVGHSLGGLIIRAMIARARPERLGRVVMLGTPNAGSEWADLVVRLRLQRVFLGKVQGFLTTMRDAEDSELLGKVDFYLGVIAGATPFGPLVPTILPRPNDGTVSVQSTMVEGMIDHVVIPVTHAAMPINADVRMQTVHFLRNGFFNRSSRRLSSAGTDRKALPQL